MTIHTGPLARVIDNHTKREIEQALATVGIKEDPAINGVQVPDYPFSFGMDTLQQVRLIPSSEVHT